MVISMGQVTHNYLIEIKDITVVSINSNRSKYIYSVLSPRAFQKLSVDINDKLTGLAFSCYNYEKTCFIIASMIYDYIKSMRKNMTNKDKELIFNVFDYRGKRFLSIFNNAKLIRVSSYYGVRLSPGMGIDPRELLITNRMLFAAMKTNNDSDLEKLAKEVIKHIIDHMR